MASLLAGISLQKKSDTKGKNLCRHPGRFLSRIYWRFPPSIPPSIPPPPGSMEQHLLLLFLVVVVAVIIYGLSSQQAGTETANSEKKPSWESSITTWL